jgi:cell division protein FtsQ
VTDPRIRRRRVEVARQVGRRRRRLLVAVLVLVALAGGGLALVHSSVFGARHVQITGASRVTDAEVLRASGLSNAPPLIDISADAVAKRIEALAWVRTARVTLSWPSTVRISVTERVPVAVVRGPGAGWSVLDSSGRVLERTLQPPAGLPVVVSAAPPPAPGQTVAKATVQLAVVAAAMPASMVAQCRDIAASANGPVVDLTDSVAALIGNTTALRDKFVALATVLAHGGLQGIGTIDVRVPSAPLLLPRNSTPQQHGTGSGP